MRANPAKLRKIIMTGRIGAFRQPRLGGFCDARLGTFPMPGTSSPNDEIG
jgi:hypothetical protein